MKREVGSLTYDSVGSEYNSKYNPRFTDPKFDKLYEEIRVKPQTHEHDSHAHDTHSTALVPEPTRMLSSLSSASQDESPWGDKWSSTSERSADTHGGSTGHTAKAEAGSSQSSTAAYPVDESLFNGDWA